MTVSDNSKLNVKFWSPGIYKINVQGKLDPMYSDRFAGMQISACTVKKAGQVTTLLGFLRDQAQLSGVLNYLYELHLPILLVRYIKENNEDNGEDSDSQR